MKESSEPSIAFYIDTLPTEDRIRSRWIYLKGKPLPQLRRDS